ncbi:MAG TPA: hypothetical protein VKX40_02795 [Aequorivita sp.]|nr:hypothetical protein [Aequorivita sp.]
MKNLKLSVFALGLASVFVACSDDDPAATVNDGTGRMSISAKASYTPLKSGEGAQQASIIELSSFRVNFTEIEFEFDDIVGEDPFYNGEDDIELKGPFEVELLSPIAIELVDIRLPNGKLEEIEFEFDESKNAQSELFNQSMRMEGTINTVPFVFWHDFEEEIELEFEDGSSNGIISNDENGIVINFDLSAVLNATPTVDLSLAVDGNGDGIIEISPKDEDGNRALAEAMKQAIKAQIDLLDD